MFAPHRYLVPYSIWHDFDSKIGTQGTSLLTISDIICTNCQVGLDKDD
jgi:hypothetical protein